MIEETKHTGNDSNELDIESYINKGFKVFYFNYFIINIVKEKIVNFIGQLREYSNRKLVTEDLLRESEHFIECSYLLNILNMTSDIKLLWMIKDTDNRYFAELVSGGPAFILFDDLPYGNEVDKNSKINHILKEKVISSAERVHNSYQFFNILSKNNTNEVVKFFTREKQSTLQIDRNTLQIERDSNQEFIDNIKKAIYKLKSKNIKITLSSVAKEIGLSRSTFQDRIKNKLKYDKVSGNFIDLNNGIKY